MTYTVLGLTYGERRLLSLIAIHGRHQPWRIELKKLAILLGSRKNPSCFDQEVLKSVIKRACFRFTLFPETPLIRPFSFEQADDGGEWALVVSLHPHALGFLRYLCPPDHDRQEISQSFRKAFAFRENRSDNC